LCLVLSSSSLTDALVEPSKQVVCIPFSKNHQFVGRCVELEVLKRRIITAQDCQTIAVVGLGGIGKTQLVLSFAYSVAEQHPEMSVFWIPALSVEAFVRATEEIAQQLGIRSATNQGEDVKELVKRHLSAPSAGKWLLIVDNADDIELLEPSTGSDGLLRYLPESRLGVTIFTTRTSSVAQRLARSDVLRLKKPTRDEAAELLERALVDADSLKDQAVVTNFLTELEHLPLAITQAAAYININEMSISEYSRLLQSTDDDVLYLMSAEIRDSTRYEESSSAVATTWILSFKQILERDAIAADLLQYISCIEWKGIPRSILPTVRPEARTLDAIGTLCSYSFLGKQTDGTTYDMHRLVHLASRIWLRKSGRAVETQAEATKHLTTIFPTDDYTNRDIWRAYLPHVTRMETRWASVVADLGGLADKKSELCLKVGRCLEVDGRTTEALHWLTECFRIRSKLAEDHPDRLASQHELAGAYQANGQVKEAVTLLQHVVKVKEDVLAEDHPSRLASQHALAGAYQANGQVKEAVTLLQHVVEVREDVLAEDHPHRLASQHALAGAYQANGQVREAVTLLQHVVKVKEDVLAEDHLSRLASQHALAGAYQANGQVKEAVTLLQHVVKVKEDILAEDHPSRLASQHELARAYQANGQVKEAVTLLQHVVEVSKDSLAEDHPHRLTYQHALTGAYQANGQVKEAVTLLQHVVKVKEDVLAEDHLSRLASQHALAGVYYANGQVKEAVTLLQHIVKVEGDDLAEDHPDRLASQHALAIAYRANGQIEQADELLETLHEK
jgi:tetratricopeptide (TPR) repeat protein